MRRTTQRQRNLIPLSNATSDNSSIMFSCPFRFTAPRSLRNARNCPGAAAAVRAGLRGADAGATAHRSAARGAPLGNARATSEPRNR